MQPNDKKKLSQNADQLLQGLIFKEVLKRSITSLKFSKNRLFILIGFFIAFFNLYLFVFTKHINGIEHTLTIVENVTTFSITILAVLITGYAIFQALATGSTLYNLVKTKQGSVSYFMRYNDYFFSVSLLYLSVIVLNFLLFIFLNGIPVNWSLPFYCTNGNNTIYSFLMSLYIILILNSLFELKSFIFNLYSVFSTNAAIAAINKANESDE
ncbi:hypothetical protein [Pontibacillus salipaludis]|uniref:Uncharacterized protein n=1 Tax=Pontibacillus salipaludis TaxID=1697394 RepID=A0ABQ1PIL0_9BACI|nr:hypothetical protein [Pontibacillus salipaludis]GGC97824.1 hypothetical protein GCM10011389_01190 [Pontibacillus salipaludis]